MEREETTLQEEQTAENVINQNADGMHSPDTFVASLENDLQNLEAAEREKVQQYIAHMRPIMAGVLIDDLGGNTAGLYNGSAIFVDQGVLMVGHSMDQTIAQTKEVKDHETYHAENDHTASMQIVEDTRGSFVATIGGRQFTEEGLIEGLTVMQTGHEFVSTEYVGFENSLASAIGSAGLDVSDVKEAVNEKKDLTLIDDRTRQEQPAETDYALAG